MIQYEDEIRNAVVGGRLTVPPEWEGFPGQAFGGFVAAALLVAAAAQTEQPRPLSLFARFHRPIPVAAPVSLALHAQRRGRTVDTLLGRLVDGEREHATVSMAFGRHGDAPIASQAVPPMAPLRGPRPVWRHLEEVGVEPPAMMRRVGFRGEAVETAQPHADGADWHLRSQWPGTSCEDLAVRAGVTLLPIDSFVGPATIQANRVDINGPWPVAMPSLDLTAWFYAPESPAADADPESPAGWLTTRTSVPVTHAAYAVGRTQVWSGDRFIAEGMSQVALIPPPPLGGSARAS